MTQDGSRLPAASGGTPSRSPARRFTEGEVSDILRRAAEAEGRSGLPTAPDLTLDDLLVAAREAGLDPAVVRRSSAIETRERGGVASVLFGAPDRREVRAVMPRSRLPDDRRDLAAAAERGLGREGEVVGSGPDHFRWQEDHIAGRTRLDLTREGEGTAIRASADRAGHYLGAWFLGLAGWALLSALTPVGSLALLPKILSYLVVPVVAARPWWRRRDRDLKKRLEQLTLDVAGIVEDAGDAQPDGRREPGRPRELPGA
ncbi:MAG: hypothetical protein P8170_17205 [Gemmatimonadota bacterium]